jgi:hypothetical protein
MNDAAFQRLADLLCELEGILTRGTHRFNRPASVYVGDFVWPQFRYKSHESLPIISCKSWRHYRELFG